MWNKQIPPNAMAGILPVDLSEEESKKYSLNTTDFKKIGVGALITLTGAFLTYVSQVVSNTNFGLYTPLIMTMLTILVNTLRHIVDGKQG